MDTVRLDFVVAGAPKAATTSLVDALREHPKVYVPFQKELSFFDRDGCLSRLDELAPHFADAAKDQLRGEGTPWYMSSSAAAKNLSGLYPHLKTIFVVREPVARARSHYLHRVSRVAEHRSFEQTLDDEISELRAGRSGHHTNYLIEPGLYATHLEVWRSHFPADQIKVLFFGDLVRRSGPALREVQDFLGLEAIELALPASNRTPGVRAPTIGRWVTRLIRSQSPVKRALAGMAPKAWRSRTRARIAELNQSQGVRPRLDIAERELSRMQSYFVPEVDSLEAMLGRPLDEWRSAGYASSTGGESR